MTRRLYVEAMQGLSELAIEQGLVIFRGETAELNARVSSENPDAITKFNWAGFVLGVHHPDKMITGARSSSGHSVIALREYGFRSNGISKVRAALARKFGEKWWQNQDAEKHIKAAAKPSVLYDKFLATANGWHQPDFKPLIRVHGITHISGGGIPTKFARDILFPRRLSAELTDLWDPPEIMKQCAEWRGMTDAECYENWNGGQGVLVTLNRDDEENFILLACCHGIEAKKVGEIFPEYEKPRLVIQSKFSDRQLVFE